MNASYDEIIQRLDRAANKGTSRAENGKIAHACALLKNPQSKFQSIHVAGTNGKGTTVCKIAAALMHEKKRVGVYTSPHITAFEERIVINGAMISKEDVERSFRPVFEIEERFQIPLSYFEYITLASFLYFAEQKCDVVVVETGLGGRFDATNVVDPLVSVITSIGLDHTQLLGNTIEEITYEKAGIIKENRPCVIGPCVPYHLIAPCAQQLKSPLHQVMGTFANFEEENGAIAAKVLELLGVSQEACEKGLQACPPCRFERVLGKKSVHVHEAGETRNGSGFENLTEKKLCFLSAQICQSQTPFFSSDKASREHAQKSECAVILDVAHNPHAIDRLLERLGNEFPGKPIIAIYGASKDKDYRTCIQKLSRKCEALTFVAAAYARAATVGELMEAAAMMGIEKNYTAASIEEALGDGLMRTEQCGGVLVICGTFYIMDEVARLLLISK